MTLTAEREDGQVPVEVPEDKSALYITAENAWGIRQGRSCADSSRYVSYNNASFSCVFGQKQITHLQQSDKIWRV